MAAGRDHDQTTALHNIAGRMLIGMTIRHQSAAPLGVAEVIDRGRLNQRVGQDTFKGLARNIAGGERAIECVRDIAANSLYLVGLKCSSVEDAPRLRLLV